MKALLTLSLLISYSAFAQTMQIAEFKKMLTANQKTLEEVHPGMSKRISSTSKIATEIGTCELDQTAVQTILSVEGSKIIVYSKEVQKPKDTPACAGFEATDLDVIFYESAPSLSDDLTDLDTIEKDVKKISKQGNFVTLEMTEATLKYDLTKSSFKSLVSYQDKDSSSNTFDMEDIDVNTFDLTNILFCESATSDACIEGDFSDILF